MSTQRQRKTKGRRDRRRTRFAIEPKTTTACPQCAKAKLAHQVCAACGYYKGKEVVKTVKKATKKK